MMDHSLSTMGSNTSFLYWMYFSTLVMCPSLMASRMYLYFRYQMLNLLKTWEISSYTFRNSSSALGPVIISMFEIIILPNSLQNSSSFPQNLNSSSLYTPDSTILITFLMMFLQMFFSQKVLGTFCLLLAFLDIFLIFFETLGTGSFYDDSSDATICTDWALFFSISTLTANPFYRKSSPKSSKTMEGSLLKKGSLQFWSSRSFNSTTSSISKLRSIWSLAKKEQCDMLLENANSSKLGQKKNYFIDLSLFMVRAKQEMSFCGVQIDYNMVHLYPCPELLLKTDQLNPCQPSSGPAALGIQQWAQWDRLRTSRHPTLSNQLASIYSNTITTTPTPSTTQYQNPIPVQIRSYEQHVLLAGLLLLDLVGVHQNHGLASADQNNSLLLALGALQSQRHLLCGLRLLPEDRFGLASVAQIAVQLPDCFLSYLRRP